MKPLPADLYIYIEREREELFYNPLKSCIFYNHTPIKDLLPPTHYPNNDLLQPARTTLTGPPHPCVDQPHRASHPYHRRYPASFPGHRSQPSLPPASFPNLLRGGRNVIPRPRNTPDRKSVV